MSAYEEELPHEILLRAAGARPGLGTDISKYVTRIDKFTAVGTGEIPSVQIMLNTTQGQFITANPDIRDEDDNRIENTPIIRQYDEIQIKMIDDYQGSPDGAGHTYSRIMFRDDRLPQQTSAGQLMQVELYGREMYLKKVKISGWFWFETFSDMIQTIVEFYNEHKGARQPGVYFAEMGNVMRPPEGPVPPYLVGTFDFGNGTNCYDALMTVINWLNLSPALGGAGRFHEMVFTDHPTNGTRIICKITPVDGNNPADITIQGKDRETQSVTETEAPVAANIVVVKGQADTGRYPPELAEFTSRLQEYNNIPLWNASVGYSKDAHVRVGNVVFRAIINTPAGTITSDVTHWSSVSKESYLQNGSFTGSGAIDAYSPWTKGKKDLVQSYGSGASPRALDNSFTSTAFPDSNLVVKDGTNYRNWADCKIKNLSDIPAHLRYARSSPPSTEDEYEETVPEDMRCLIDSRISQAWDPDSRFYDTATNTWKSDEFGVLYFDALVQFRNGKWIVVREPHKTMEIAVLDEPNVYIYTRVINAGNTYRSRLAADVASGRTKITPTTQGAQFYGWRGLQQGTAGAWLGLDCFHFPSTIRNVPIRGVDFPTGLVNPDDAGPLGTDSGVEVQYIWGAMTSDATHSEMAFAELLETLRNHFGFFGDWLTNIVTNAEYFLTQRGAYTMGWWTTLFKAPSPKWGDSADRQTGAIFGGDIDNKVSVLDLNNFNYTHDGKTGWAADNAKEFGRITGIHFLLNFDIVQGVNPGATSRIPGATGNQVFRCTIYDTEDNVWIQDFTYRFLGDTQQVILPISGFKIYRARNPIASTLSDSIKNIITPELKILEIFEKRRVKMITLQWQEGYDEAGRYSPWTISRFLLDLGAQLLFLSRIRTIGVIDGFGFVKAPYAIAKKTKDPLAADPSVGDIEWHHLMENIPEYPNVSNVEQLKKIAQAELDLAQFQKDNFVIRTTGKCDLKPGDVFWFQDEDMIGLPLARKKLLVKKINYTVNAPDTITEGGTPGGFIRYITAKDVINLNAPV